MSNVGKRKPHMLIFSSVRQNTQYPQDKGKEVYLVMVLVLDCLAWKQRHYSVGALRSRVISFMVPWRAEEERQREMGEEPKTDLETTLLTTQTYKEVCSTNHRVRFQRQSNCNPVTTAKSFPFFNFLPKYKSHLISK